MTPERVRLLIADDHSLVRRGMRAVLGTAPDLEIVGEAATGREAVMLAESLEPDVILMDLRMPDLSGIEATRQILASQPDRRILVVTLFQDDDSVFLALRAGARGYVLKDADDEELIAAIRAVAGGAAIFSPAVATRVLTLFSAPRPPAVEPFPTLTTREREILELIAAGLSNPRIAQRLGISVKTVGNHVSVIFGKLQVADRAEAIERAQEAGLGRRHP
ncbi:MAG TPA: response regulator transcription factor [Thermomicrobiaceae bacterium]|nr:response regulator transcription factor [Thermomicrobiaceae bacterium]